MDIRYPEPWYEAYERGNKSDNLVKALEFGAFRELPDSIDAGRSLDIGTATGRYVRALSKLGFDAYGVDHLQHAVNAAARLLAQVDLDTDRIKRADARALPFEDGCFDLVTCMMGTIVHSHDTRSMLREIGRVLRSDGAFIFSIWRPEAVECGFLSVNTPEINRWLTHICTEVHPIESLLGEPGFSLVEIKECVLAKRNIYLSMSSDCAVWQDFEVHLRARHHGLQGELGLYLCKKPR